MRLRILIFILFLFSNGCWLTAQTSNASLITKYINKADSVGKDGDYKNAIKLRKKALNLQQLTSPPPYSDLIANYRTMGYYFRKWGKYNESFPHQKKAVELAENKLPKNHHELEKAYNGLGGYYFGKQQYNNALAFFQKALDAGIASNSEGLADYYNNLGISFQALGKPQEAMAAYRESLRFNLQSIGFYNSKTADNYDNLGTLYFNLNQFESAIAYHDSAEIILDSIFAKGSIHFAGMYNNKGAVYNKMGDHRNALVYLEKSLGLFEKYGSGNHPEVANIYSNIGLLLQDKGDYDKALSYFKKALGIRASNFEKGNPSIARTHFYLGNVYLAKLDFERAFAELQESLTIFESSFNVSQGEIADVRNSLGNYYREIGNQNEALNQYNKALQINSSRIDQNDLDVANSYALIGKVYLSKNQHVKAKGFFQKALDIRFKVYGEEHAIIAESYSDLSLSCDNNQACIKENIKQAYRHIKYDLSNSLSFEKALSSITLLKIMQAEGGLSLGLFEETKDTVFLKKADRTFGTAIELINFIKTSLEQPGSRLALQDNFYLIYEKAILVKHLLKEKTGEKRYWNEAFKIAEQSNAILLMEAIQSIQAEQFAGIPDSLLELERSYKTALSFLEKRLYEEELKNDSRNAQLLKEINNRIFEVHSKQHKLMDYFKTNHKEYFKLKYQSNIVLIDRIQKNLLREDQTMISYFVGENKLFVFVISKDEFELVEVNKDFPLEVWVEEFRNSIYRFNPSDNNTAILNQKLANIGHELYQLIFEPCSKHISTESLVIIPGGVLGYLPFDALLSQPTDNFNDFDSFDYLINQYSISYSFSATLLDEMINGHHKEKPFIAFAPAYYGDTLNVSRSNDPWRAVLGQLRFNMQEARNIHNLMGGLMYLDSLATEEKFMEVASSAGILHLATHGKSNDHNGDYSYLAFFQTADSIENELLFVKNLYEMQIPASLVVLSACETGIGELQRGEGIISLARGFSYAGAASIVTTLWSIDDNASATIMFDFYKNMKDGDPKDIALRKAKLTYIEKNKGNNRTHPLFWAAFVPMGNMEALGGGFNWWLLIGIAFVSLLAFYFLKK